jgi:hypothetical protein
MTRTDKVRSFIASSSVQFFCFFYPPIIIPIGFRITITQHETLVHTGVLGNGLARGRAALHTGSTL